MKILCTLLLAFLSTAVFAQTKTRPKTKAPTQKDMESAMKDAQAMMDEAMKEMSDEDRAMMDSMGIKMPNIKNIKVPKATDQELAVAWDDENRVVPKKDEARIASIPKNVTTAKLGAYIAAIQKKLLVQLDAKTVSVGNKVYTEILAKARSSHQAGNMATALWLDGRTELTLYLLGKICSEDATQTDNLSNYAAALTMLGGEHLAIPILQNLNTQYKRNSTILNNLGQAWLGLGDLFKAEKYLDSAIAIYPFHPQANLSKAVIEESKGNTTKAIDHVKKSIQDSYSKEKEEKLNKLGYKLVERDLSAPFGPGTDPLGLEQTKRPDYPTSVGQVNALYPYWKQFNEACDTKMEKIRKEIDEYTAKYAKSSAAMASGVLNAINTGTTAVIKEPLFIRRASMHLKERETFYGVKMKAQADLYLKLQNDLTEIRKKYLYGQPEDPCQTRLAFANARLKALNERKRSYDEQALTLFRHYFNDMAYWSQFTSVDPNAFKVIVLQFQLGWLQKNREHQPEEMNEYFGQFTSCAEKESAGPGKLAEFDDVACNYKASYNFGIVAQEINCSHTTTTYQIGDQTLIERELGTKHIGSTVVMNVEQAVAGRAGPLQVKGYVKGSLTTELDENRQVKDWNGTVTVGAETSGGVKTGPVKLGGSVTTELRVEMSSKGPTDAIMIGSATASAGAYGQSVKIGVEDRVSLVSGHGSVRTTGLGKTTISSW